MRKGGGNMTDNKYWIFLEMLRRSGVVNMYGSAPYVEHEFGVNHKEAVAIVSDWMRNYKASDYEGMA